MADQITKEAINTWGDDTIGPGMLSSPHIAYCVERYGIIEGYDRSCLDSATYHMRIGGSVLTWENGQKLEFTLSPANDRNKDERSSLELKPNSLTFVTTIEKFNLPKDIIARFNLKSKWVHKGLLLGTGPIVDPELRANLLIPLHNFSSESVTLNYGDKLISVEFTKTLNPDDKPQSHGKLFEYKKNKSRIFDFHGYRERIGLVKAESSVLSAIDKYSKTIDDYARELTKTKEDYQKELTSISDDYRRSNRKFSWIGGFTAVGTLVALIVLVVTTWMIISSAFDQLNKAQNLIGQFKEENTASIDSSLKSAYADLKAQLLVLNKNIEENRELVIGSADNTQARWNSIEEKIRAIEMRMNKLELEMDNTSVRGNKK